MPYPNLSDLEGEERERVAEAHEVFLRACDFETARLELQLPEHPDHFRERWEKHVIPVLRAEQEKAAAEMTRMMRELGYEK